MSKSRKVKNAQKRLSPALVVSLLIVLAFAISLFVRIYFPYDKVFTGDWVKFTTVDGYYQMRLVDNLVYNFPHLISFDPYLNYPFSLEIHKIHFFNRLLAGIIWIVSLGSPNQHTIDVVGVYFPAVLGALTTIPVYFIGKALFGRWVGVLAAILIALMPGEFLGRSILGNTDHHVAETLFSTIAVMFLVLAIKASRDRDLTFAHLGQRDRAVLGKPALYCLLSGLFLGLYLITWIGALLFVFILFAYFVIQFIIDHLRRQSVDYLCLVGTTVFLVASIIFAVVAFELFKLIPVIIALFTPVVLSFISRWLANKRIRPVYYPLALLGLAGVGLALFYAIAPATLREMLGLFSVFNPGIALTILEMQPLLYPGGTFTWALAWGNFTTGFFLSFISLGILFYLLIKQGRTELTFLIVWSLIILAATLGQRRFAYYFAVNVSLLTAYLSWQMFPLIGKYRASFSSVFRYAIISLTAIAIFFLVFYPTVRLTILTASQTRFAPSDAWVSSLLWLKENTPEPFGESDFYYQLYQPLSPGEKYQPPPSAYGVMAWSDYGFWIARIGHRPALLLPSPGGQYVAAFLLSQDENSTQKVQWGRGEIMSESEIIQKLDAEYIMLDYETVTGKFWALAEWGGKDRTEFFDVYYVLQQGKLTPLILFHPSYYQSLMVRLYNFDGQAVTPKSSTVISYEEKLIQDKVVIKLITNIQTFPSYEEANSYISNQKSGNHRIANDNPFVSPVPLPALKYFKLIHSSESVITMPNVGSIPSVKIFQDTR